MPKKEDKKPKPVVKVEVKEPLKTTDTDRLFYTSPFDKRLKFSEEEELVIIRDIESHIQQCKIERGILDLEAKWRDWRDQYDAVAEYKDFPFDDCSNLYIPITAMTCDVMKVKAKAQMFVNPAMLCKPLPGQEGENLYNDIKLKEQYINYKILEELEAEAKLDPIILDAINLGTGIAKISYLRQMDCDCESLEIYDGKNDDDLQRFVETYAKENSGVAYQRYIADLQAGKTVTVWTKKDKLVYDGEVVSYVKLEDLYVRPGIDDINNQNIISEKFSMTWGELLNKVNTKFFDKEPVMELVNRHNDYMTRQYEVYESIYYKYDGLKYKRIVITHLADNNKILRAITFPYEHRKPYYIPYYIERVPGCFYGKGLAKRLHDTNIGLNGFWNHSVDSATMQVAPAFKALKDSFDPTAKKWGPAIIWWITNGDMKSVQRMDAGGSVGFGEILNLISRLERYAEWLSGVSAYATGRESPSDPNAPASKAFMLLKESNLRINDCIKSLHRSNVFLYELVDSMNNQFSSGELKYNKYQNDKLETIDISRKLLSIKVQYVPQLSDITVNKELQKQEDARFGGFLLQLPEIGQNPAARKKVIEILINNQGGIWSKSLKDLLPEQEPIGQNMPGAVMPPGSTGATPSPLLSPLLNGTGGMPNASE